MSGLVVDLVRLLHVVYVGLLIAAPLLLIAGALRDIPWLTSSRMRRLHVGCVLFALVQFAYDLPCPLTQLEIALGGAPDASVFLLDWASLPGDMRTALLVIGVLYVTVSVIAHVQAWRSRRQAISAARPV